MSVKRHTMLCRRIVARRDANVSFLSSLIEPESPWCLQRNAAALVFLDYLDSLVGKHRRAAQQLFCRVALRRFAFRRGHICGTTTHTMRSGAPALLYNLKNHVIGAAASPPPPPLYQSFQNR